MTALNSLGRGVHSFSALWMLDTTLGVFVFVCWLFFSLSCFWFKYCRKIFEINVSVSVKRNSRNRQNRHTDGFLWPAEASKTTPFVCHLLCESGGWLKAMNCFGSQYFYSAFITVLNASNVLHVLQKYNISFEVKKQSWPWTEMCFVYNSSFQYTSPTDKLQSFQSLQKCIQHTRGVAGSNKVGWK